MNRRNFFRTMVGGVAAAATMKLAKPKKVLCVETEYPYSTREIDIADLPAAPPNVYAYSIVYITKNGYVTVPSPAHRL